MIVSAQKNQWGILGTIWGALMVEQIEFIFIDTYQNDKKMLCAVVRS